MKKIVTKPNELALQKEFVIPFFIEEQSRGGLGYKKVMASSISNSLIIDSDLMEFLKESELNKRNYAQLLKKYNSDEVLLEKELMAFLEEKILSARNMATFLKDEQISFKGIGFSLFHRSASLNGDRDFDENIFSVVEELPYNYKYMDKKIFGFRPDISLFVNGIYLGYSELKSNYGTQTAKKNGKKKIKGDYEKAVKAYLEHIEADVSLGDKEKKQHRRDMLKIFEKAIWISTTDVHESYILRDIVQFFEIIKNRDKAYEEKIYKAIKAYPLSDENRESNDKRVLLREIFGVHFGKKMIEKEILYYNFIEREIEDLEGKKSLKNAEGRLISPRPKQKFGVDKILAKIDEFLEHESEPDYFLNKLKRELKGLSSKRRDELIKQRMGYHNNRSVYSLLLQYSAGFGKSNIIGWSALQLKDLKRDGEYVYDKVIIVVDRLQLRDQIDTKLFNMNINNSNYIEASSKASFHKALIGKEQVVIINIQKFQDVGIDDKKTLEALGDKRVVFLIDEIHRSNNGDQNEEMLNIFDEIQTSCDKASSKSGEKKNLIIGFTATPSDVTLARFGEYGRYGKSEGFWKPFDSYTMNEAINDGYILDPTKTILYISSKMYFEMPKDKVEGLSSEEIEKQYRFKKKNIYENEERIDAISQNIAQHLVQSVYKKIGKRAKAMLAVSSIKSAQLYIVSIREHFSRIAYEKKTSKNDFGNAPIYIVYSDEQGTKSATSLNNGLSETRVLQKFASDKNALIIVVDKLQTGFDEPRLHTLFLDKEIKGINAIQTICRVNRKTKNKSDCAIVDYSYKNINYSNIQNAFDKFSDLVVSDFNPLGVLKSLKKDYKLLMKSSIYQDYFISFRDKYCLNKKRELHFYMDLEKSFRSYIKLHENESRLLKEIVSQYFTSLETLNYVLMFDEKYKEPCFLAFFSLFNDIFREIYHDRDDVEDIIISFDESIGMIEPEFIKEKEKNPNSGDGGGQEYKYDILKIIKELNKNEENIEEKIEAFEEKIELFFTYVKTHKDFTKLSAKMSDSQFAEDEVYSDFTKLYNQFKRRNRDDIFIKYTQSLVEKLCDDFRKVRE